jgi:phospholipid/cholesterol/gamma-HCH transport system substrate-binding protein
MKQSAEIFYFISLIILSHNIFNHFFIIIQYISNLNNKETKMRISTRHKVAATVNQAPVVKKSNEEVTNIIGNTKKITDEMVTADFKGVISNASQTLKTFNDVLASAQKGEGTLGKLLGDDKLFNELVQTNKGLQELVEDIQMHPERYIHFSVFGAKTKGVPLSPEEEQKLRLILDSTVTN